MHLCAYVYEVHTGKFLSREFCHYDETFPVFSGSLRRRVMILNAGISETIRADQIDEALVVEAAVSMVGQEGMMRGGGWRPEVRNGYLLNAAGEFRGASRSCLDERLSVWSWNKHSRGS